MRSFKILQVAFLVLIMVFPVFAQLELPRTSPGASVSQTVGITHVKIDYYRPGVKGRVIWGELVPYNEIWRTGANQATTIAFDTDVKIEGNKISKGKYSLFTIPSQNEWTVVINKNADLWGTMGYKQEEDVLRFLVKPQTADMRERMIFTFDNVTNNSVQVALHWEKIRVAFTLSVDVDSLVMAAANQEISWQTPYQAANFALENNLDMAKVEQWLAVSMDLDKNYWNTALQARIMKKQGKNKEAVKTLESAIQMGKEMERAPFNLQEMEEMLAEWKK